MPINNRVVNTNSKPAEFRVVFGRSICEKHLTSTTAIKHRLTYAAEENSNKTLMTYKYHFLTMTSIR